MCRKMKFQMFVARDILLVFLAIQAVIASIGAMAYLLDKDGKFRNSFSGDWDGFLSKHPVPFYYSVGVVVFSALVGVCGIILDCSLCSSLNTNYPYVAGSSNCAIDSAEGCIVVIVVFVIIFAVLGLFFGFVAATVGAQRILQRHCGILMKKELTKEYVVEDLRGCYTPPKMNPEHEQRLKMLQLM
ncbi:hypothetical protein QOZ80_1BG0073730 [Eleusine coracana subsp. coracana]|nr:hypothetical protein QOZ80_1BG0073730 [Eleusine coracana subsp. coracana]